MLCFRQILYELVYSWESHHKNKKVNFLLRHSVLCRPVPQTGPSGFYWQQPRQQDAPAVADHLLTVAPVAAAHDVAAPASVPQQHRSVEQGHRSVTHKHRSVTHQQRSVKKGHRSVTHKHRSVTYQQRSVKKGHRSVTHKHRSVTHQQRSVKRA